MQKRFKWSRTAIWLLVIALSATAGCSSADNSTPPPTSANSTASAVATTHIGEGTFGPFTGPWSGHDRGLNISVTGDAHEDISDGCCTKVITLDFQLSIPTNSAETWTADAKVTAVQPYSEFFDGGEPPPTVGEQRTIVIANGVITSPFTDATYCDTAQSAVGTCGA